MQRWIGANPTLLQKNMSSKFKKELSNAEHTVLNSNEIVLKAIEVELDKKSGKEIDGVLTLTNIKMIFISKNQFYSFEYSSIRNIQITADGKDKKEWKLIFFSGRNKYEIDDIKKNDDTEEFFYLLQEKVKNPIQEFQTSVTHDFNYFLHADRLNDFKVNGIKVTPFLMKRDDQGIGSNGQRLLKEKHPYATLITQGFFKDSEKKKGNFIVVDLMVMLYEYDQQTRKAKKIAAWPLAFFNGCKIDHFALKTEVITSEGKLVLNNLGKQFAETLIAQNIPFILLKRKWYKKIIGFRSGKWWKASIASLMYMFILFIGIGIVFGEDTTEKKKITSTSTSVKTESKEQQDESVKEAQSAEEQKKKEEEEATRLAEEQRQKEEAARLAEEQRQKEEAARLAEEQRQKEEAARLAEEQRQKEEAERLAAQQAQQQASQNIFYANCSEVRAAGAAPIHQGEPGYSRKLDRDGDGIACDQ
ncbi:excalibur calcium-binding domain-containing protein [Neobacillus sp. K501]